MDYPMTGHVAVVSGGARGIGRAISERLLDAGVIVVLADIRGELAASTARELGGRGTVSSRQVDVREWGAVHQLFEDVAKEHGHIDICVTSAGIQEAGPSLEMEEPRWRDVLDVNLGGVFVCCQAAGRQMVEQGEGSIINIASAAGVLGLPGRAPYCAAKAGISSLTRVLATEWAEAGVRVNAIGPGWVMTDLVREAIEIGRLNEDEIKRKTPLRRLATAVEIAEVALFLASDASSYITGQTIYPDGGFTSSGA
jgi:NAD(P)-dependent dehydrogenase (short-subunit alcohol dehydrogenase family)